MGRRRCVKILVLDFDGVVTRLDVDWRTIRSEASEIAGFEISSLNDFWRDYFGTDIYFAVSRYVEAFELEAAEAAKPVKGVAEVIEHAAQKGIKVYIATMQPKALVERFLKKHGLIDSIAGILGRESAPTKSSMLKRIMEIEGAEPEEIMLVDDSSKVIDSCREAGFRCLHAKNDLHNVIQILEELFVHPCS